MDKEKATKLVREAASEHDRGMLKLFLFPWLYSQNKEENKMETDNKRFGLTQQAIISNEPPINSGDIWVAVDESGTVMRSMKIICRHPFEIDKIIVEEGKGSLKTGRMVGEINKVPEFNLRYVFNPES